MFGKKYATPDGLQRTLIVSGLAAYAVGLAQTLYLFYQQSFTNPNFSGFWPILLWQALPVAFFGLAYYLNPRKKLTPVQKIFEAMVLSMIGVSAFSVLSQGVSYLTSGGLMAENFLMYQIVLMSVMVVGFGGVLYFLVYTKRWK
ncbi:MAG TPA: hypothetical protein VJM32_06390 [Candidatus Saccharimonadales bacterium]|nr:hypothetical protein [Candidatus Saccharimonadales bacterium]